MYMSGLLSQLDHFCLITKLMHGDIKPVTEAGVKNLSIVTCSTKSVQVCMFRGVPHRFPGGSLAYLGKVKENS